MDEQIRLNLADLPTMHPGVGAELLRQYAPCLVARLVLDIDELSNPNCLRDVLIDHRKRDGVNVFPVSVVLGGICTRQYVVSIPHTIPQRTITEQAAVCLAALGVYHLEQLIVHRVVEPGEADGDYTVHYYQEGRAAQMEVSGLQVDDSPSGSKLRALLVKKSKQVKSGLVSVTAFAYRPTSSPYSILCDAESGVPVVPESGDGT
jgi:hypothetical protein